MTREMFWHLTNRGKVSAVYYRLRRCFVEPAPDAVRCWMGAPVDPMIHCPRVAFKRIERGNAVPTLWCVHHQREIARREAPAKSEGSQLDENSAAPNDGRYERADDASRSPQ